MFRSFRRYLIFLGLVLCVGTYAGPKTLDSVAKGEPIIRGSVAPPNMHIKVVAQKFEKPRVLWINHALLHEMGIILPSDPLKRDDLILDLFAYTALPDGTEITRDDQKIMYPDRYGGNGMGKSGGSGRAAAVGDFQVKGAGIITALVDATKTELDEDATLQDRITIAINDFAHAHGSASITEAIREAIFGELLHEESPYGANRVAFVLDSGESTKYFPLISERRGLVVRQNSFRPGHLLVNEDRTVDLEENKIRVAGYSDFLIDTFERLGMSGTGSDGKAEKLTRGLEEYARRLGDVYATQYARQIYRGAESTSNIEIDGRLIDYGGSTLVTGYPKATYADGGENGSTVQVIDSLDVFVKGLRKSMPADLKTAIPNKKTLVGIFRESYRKTLDQEFLALLGIPKEWLEQISVNAELKQLPSTLKTLAAKGNREAKDTHLEVGKNEGTYDFTKLMPVLAENYNHWHETAKMVETLKEFPKSDHLKEVLELLPKLKLQMDESAQAAGISQENLRNYLVHSTRLRNSVYEPLVRGPERTVNLMAVTGKLVPGSSTKLMDDFISLMLEKGIRNPKNLPPFTTVLESRIVQGTPITVYKAFNAKTGKEEFIGKMKIDPESPYVWTRQNLTSDPLVITEINGDAIFPINEEKFSHIRFKRTNQKTREYQRFSIDENRAVEFLEGVKKFRLPVAKAALASTPILWSGVNGVDAASKVVTQAAATSVVATREAALVAAEKAKEATAAAGAACSDVIAKTGAFLGSLKDKWGW